MIRISKFLAVSALALGLTLRAAAWAQAEALSATATPAQAGHPSEHPAEHLAEGEIRRLDPETGKLTIRHGKIRNLDMPPMTMVFTARAGTFISSVLQGLG